MRDKPAKLATVILAAAELAEFSLLIDALGRHSAAVKQQLIAEMQAAMPDKPSIEQRDAHWNRQSMAAEYCNWLSEQEGIPENQWIYEPNDDGEFADGMRIKEDFLEFGGYRLPTQAEWEYACIVGARGPYSFGAPVALLKEYGRFRP